MYRRAARADAIDEYSRRLVAALGRAGVPVGYVGDGLASARRQVPDPPWILLQYNPFAYGRWGVAPGLVREAAAWRRSAGVLLGVSVHEAWVETHDRGRARWRSALMGAYQHAQLSALLSTADVVLAASERLARRVGRCAVHLPVASNVTPLAIGRDEARARLGLGEELVVCLFGSGHPSRALEYAAAAIELLVRARGPRLVRVLNLGLGAPALDVREAVVVETPGHLEEGELSIRLHASDILLLPFADGLSTRRTTLMAGLAHGVPVVGLGGPDTDAVLAGSRAALCLTPIGDVDAFARAALELAGDPSRRRAAGEAGRELYAKHFDWPVMARRVAAALGVDRP